MSPPPTPPSGWYGDWNEWNGMEILGDHGPVRGPAPPRGGGAVGLRVRERGAQSYICIHIYIYVYADAYIVIHI